MKLTAACSIALALGALVLMTDSAQAATTQATGASMPILTVGGAQATWVKSVEGGNQVADSVAEPRSLEKSPFAKKHVGAIHIEPLQVDFGMDRMLSGWVSDAFNGNALPKAVGLSMMDFNHRETGKVDLLGARLVEVDFPALDAADKSVYYTHLVLQPEAVRRSPGSQAVVASVAVPTHPQVLGNFRVTVGALPCGRVSKVGALTVKTGPSGLSISNLVLTISGGDLKSWQDWQDASMKTASNEKPELSDAQEKTGMIEMLASDMTTVTSRLSFRGLGLVRVAMDKFTNNGDAIERFTAEMYVEDIKLVLP